MEEKLKELIFKVCAGFPTRDVCICNISDQKRFARMSHYAWKYELGFHPDMFKEALSSLDKFKCLSGDELDTKANELCKEADFAKSMFHAAFDLEKLSI